MRVCLALFLLVLIAGCRGGTPPPSPLAGLAEDGARETGQRIEKAHQFLATDVLAHPGIAALFKGGSADAAKSVQWNDTPFLVVGAYDTSNRALAILPRGDATILPLLDAPGPEIGDLVRIPNTFDFTLPMHQTLKEPAGATLRALIDVEHVLMTGVLKPMAVAAQGIAFLANKDRRIELSTHPVLLGNTLEHWKIPVPSPQKPGQGRIDIGGTPYQVATALSGTNGWIIGVAQPAALAAQGQ